jgi:hypothetical protein
MLARLKLYFTPRSALVKRQIKFAKLMEGGQWARLEAFIISEPNGTFAEAIKDGFLSRAEFISIARWNGWL